MAHRVDLLCPLAPLFHSSKPMMRTDLPIPPGSVSQRGIGTARYRWTLVGNDSRGQLRGARTSLIRNPASGDRILQCHPQHPEDPNASVHGGMLWYHPESSDLEVHFIAD
jgi:hypothetical protein